MAIPQDDNASEQAAKKAGEQANSDAILKKVMQMVAEIAAARTPEEVTALVNKLMELAGLVGGSNSVSQAISGAIASAQSRMSELTQAERAAIAMRIENSDFLDADTKKLYKGIDEHLTDDERIYLDKINPGEIYQIAAFDENGQLIEGQTVSVKGAKLQESFILLKAYENKENLTPEQRGSLNMKLHGHTGEAQTPEEHKRGKAALKEAINIRQGDAYLLAATPQEKNEILAQTPIMQALVNQLRQQNPTERNARQTPDPAEKALQEHLKSSNRIALKRKDGTAHPKDIPLPVITPEEKKATTEQNHVITAVADQLKSTPASVQENYAEISPQELALKRLLQTDNTSISPSEFTSLPSLPAAVKPEELATASEITVRPTMPGGDEFAGMINDAPTQLTLSENAMQAAAKVMSDQTPIQSAALPPEPPPLILSESAKELIANPPQSTTEPVSDVLPAQLAIPAHIRNSGITRR